MKRSLLAVCAGMIATVGLAQGPVYSVNVVGFQKMTLERGKLYLIATAFEDINGNVLHAADVIGDQLPINSECHFYDGSPYQSDARGFAGWSSNIEFRGFMGFWVKVPAGAANPTYDLVLKGQVPMDSTVSNVVVSGLNMLGFPYTADVDFTNTALYASSQINDELHIFNSATGLYDSYAKSFAGWGASGEALVLEQGVGFWYKSNAGSPKLVEESRPYSEN